MTGPNSPHLKSLPQGTHPPAGAEPARPLRAVGASKGVASGVPSLSDPHPTGHLTPCSFPHDAKEAA